MGITAKGGWLAEFHFYLTGLDIPEKAAMIERQGFAFASATNGRLGLERVLERRPDLILLDLTMPVMDGFDFLRELRAEPGWRDIPVVVLSSKDLTRAERSTLEGAADQVLAKSEASMRELSARIREIVGADRGATGTPPRR